MAINFPISPAVNDVYTFAGKSWKWNGFAWDYVDPILISTGVSSDTVFITSSTVGFSFLTNTTFKQLMIQHVANAVNYPTVMGSATGSPVQIEARGTDANIGVNIVTKGTGQFTINGSPIRMTASNIANTPAGNIAAINVQDAINELDTEKLAKSGGPITGNITMAVNGPYLTHGGGAILGTRAITGTLTPSPSNWYRLITCPVANAGQAVEFYFAISQRHLLMKVSFAKTTKGVNYGGGILEVELLGSYQYGFAHPYNWRIVDNGTNSSTHVDIKFTSANGVTALDYQILAINAIALDGTSHITFPMTSMGSAAGTGATNYGFSMGAGTGDGWAWQNVILNASNGAQAALNNAFTRVVSTAIAM